MKKILIVVAIMAIAFVSCKKEKADSSDICASGMVYYDGDPNVGGLGWIIVTDSVAWKYVPPENLDVALQIHGLLVDFCYYKTDRDFVCRCPPPVKKWVHLTSIKVQ